MRSLGYISWGFRGKTMQQYTVMKQDTTFLGVIEKWSLISFISLNGKMIINNESNMEGSYRWHYSKWKRIQETWRYGNYLSFLCSYSRSGHFPMPQRGGSVGSTAYVSMVVERWLKGGWNHDQLSKPHVILVYGLADTDLRRNVHYSRVDLSSAQNLLSWPCPRIPVGVLMLDYHYRLVQSCITLEDSYGFVWK